MAQRLLKDAVLAVKDAHLGRGGAGVDNKNVIRHSDFLLRLQNYKIKRKTVSVIMLILYTML